MSVIVSDAGFKPDDWDYDFIALEDLPANHAGPVLSIDLPSDADPNTLSNRLAEIDMIRIDFPSFADGRGFTIARRLRLMGFEGRLRAKGHVIADQYAMARRSGFDDVEIDEDLARRQPENQWRDRAGWQTHDYQSRLRG
ncbi:DUF934 domain-containing protein [Litoreibacter roseus]|uniref:Oxidoreductase n=1 Tax=Litoreibacter roseus TaxID=2601869 RepID=A0A6N6JD49_9RHOB|nr:DUF934 domain-containing protein [Litoreibacter roseus]GFE64034.1 hypothetical protein KIN_11080 [Litoreibacter roseus]